jgi:putative transposase
MVLFQGVRPFYFITFNTRQHRKLLATDAVHDAFCKFAERAQVEHGVAVGRYVLMPDHVHLFVALPEDARLAPWVKALKAVLGKTLSAGGVTRPYW